MVHHLMMIGARFFISILGKFVSSHFGDCGHIELKKVLPNFVTRTALSSVECTKCAQSGTRIRSGEATKLPKDRYFSVAAAEYLY